MNSTKNIVPTHCNTLFSR